MIPITFGEYFFCFELKKNEVPWIGHIPLNRFYEILQINAQKPPASIIETLVKIGFIDCSLWAIKRWSFFRKYFKMWPREWLDSASPTKKPTI